MIRRLETLIEPNTTDRVVLQCLYDLYHPVGIRKEKNLHGYLMQYICNTTVLPNDLAMLVAETCYGKDACQHKMVEINITQRNSTANTWVPAIVSGIGQSSITCFVVNGVHILPIDSDTKFTMRLSLKQVGSSLKIAPLNTHTKPQSSVDAIVIGEIGCLGPGNLVPVVTTSGIFLVATSALERGDQIFVSAPFNKGERARVKQVVCNKNKTHRHMVEYKGHLFTPGHPIWHDGKWNRADTLGSVVFMPMPCVYSVLIDSPVSSLLLDNGVVCQTVA